MEKQRATVFKMADEEVPEVPGLELLEGQIKLNKINKEIVDTFVKKIIVYDRARIEIKCKFRDKFREAEKLEKCSD